MNSQEIKKLEQNVLKILKKHLKKNDKIIIGISGGPDSIFLLNLFLKFKEKTPIKIILAHINHQLRKDADKEQKFVENMAKTLNFHLHTKTSNIAALSKKTKKGVEETGRKVRYDFFKTLAKKYNAAFIATAHHADDNIETIIMNLIRGANLKGLSGIQEKDGILLRPLLDITKNEIIDYLKTKKIKYIIDKSNFSDIYKRNIIRKKIIPEMKKLNPGLPKTISKNAKILREIFIFLDTKVEEWLSKNDIKKTKTKLTINAKTFKKLNPALQKSIIFKIYKSLVENTKNLENIHVEEVLKIINRNIGKKQKLLGKLKVSINKNLIKFTLMGQ